MQFRFPRSLRLQAVMVPEEYRDSPMAFKFFQKGKH